MFTKQVMGWVGFGKFCLLAVAIALASGCASTNYPAAPTTAASDDYKYIIGPGDSVNIVVWRNPELSMSVPVRPDGRLAAPLVEDLVAQGKNPTTLARDIEQALAKFIRDPVVTVIVGGFVGPYSEQIRVVGEAAKPQALPYKQKMTLLEDDRGGRDYRFCGWQSCLYSAYQRRQQAIQCEAARSDQARRFFGQCRHEAGRHSDHPAKLVLIPARLASTARQVGRRTNRTEKTTPTWMRS